MIELLVQMNPVKVVNYLNLITPYNNIYYYYVIFGES